MKRPWAPWYWFSMCASTCLMLEACVNFCILISNKKVSIHIISNTCTAWSIHEPLSLKHGLQLGAGLKHGACVKFYVLVLSQNTHVFMLYSCNKPSMVWSVHRALGQLWSRTDHCSWTFYMLMKWSPHLAENLRDHYLGNEFIDKNFVIIILVTSFQPQTSWSLYW